jgi:hypothetical protein
MGGGFQTQYATTTIGQRRRQRLDLQACIDPANCDEKMNDQIRSDHTLDTVYENAYSFLSFRKPCIYGRPFFFYHYAALSYYILGVFCISCH